MLYDEPQHDPLSIPPGLEGLSREDAIEAIKEWFFENFEDPVRNTPYEGEYIYIWGGPYETRDIIENIFADTASDELINAAVKELEREGDQWVPNSRRFQSPDEFEPDPKKLHEEMQRRIRAVRNALHMLSNLPGPPAGMGHNRPPEPLDPEPLDAKDRAELSTALSVLEAQPIAPSDGGKAAAEAQAKLETKLHKLGQWLALQGTVFTQEAVKEAGKQFGKWAPAAIWLVLMDRLLGVSQIVTEWLKIIHPPF